MAKDVETSRTTLEELRRAVRDADPGAFLILPRIVRRVIKHDRQLPGFGLRVPHRKCHVIAREALLDVVDRSELGLSDDAPLPDRVILLAQPSARAMEESPAETLLLRQWRLLFHARVHLAMESKPEDAFGAAEMRRRIHVIGEGAFDEIRSVLAQEDMLLPPRGDAATP